jgi:ketosteroid isomerase-like protein
VAVRALAFDVFGTSERNVERVRRGYAALASGDMETVRAFLDPKVTFEEGLEDVRNHPARFIAAGDRVKVERRQLRGWEVADGRGDSAETAAADP